MVTISPVFADRNAHALDLQKLANALTEIGFWR
jgi:hypothetical protein